MHHLEHNVRGCSSAIPGLVVSSLLRFVALRQTKPLEMGFLLGSNQFTTALACPGPPKIEEPQAAPHRPSLDGVDPDMGRY